MIPKMGSPTLDADGDKLAITIDKANKQWVARIDGTDPEYDYEREFVSPYDQGTTTVAIEDGDVFERVWYSHGGREKGREYYVVAGGDLCEIPEAQVERALEATVVEITDVRDAAAAGPATTAGEADAAADGGQQATIEVPAADVNALLDEWAVPGADHIDATEVATVRFFRDGGEPEGRLTDEGRAATGDAHYDSAGYIRLDLGGDPGPWLGLGSFDALAEELRAVDADQGSEPDPDVRTDGGQQQAGRSTTTDLEAVEQWHRGIRGDGGYATTGGNVQHTVFEAALEAGGRVPIEEGVSVHNEGYLASVTVPVYVPDANAFPARVEDHVTETIASDTQVDVHPRAQGDEVVQAFRDGAADRFTADEVSSIVANAMAHPATPMECGQVFEDVESDGPRLPEIVVADAGEADAIGAGKKRHQTTLQAYFYELLNVHPQTRDLHRVEVAVHVSADNPTYV